jgi:hypothetical protein
MHRRKNILAAIRQRRGSLGRSVVVLFASASFALGGAPCAAMAMSASGAADEPAGLRTSKQADAHEHSVHQDHAGSPARGEPENPAPARCPHCPPMGAMHGHASSSAHSFCSADDGSDQNLPGASPASAKHAPLVATFETPRSLSFHPPPLRFTRSSVPLRSTVALNVRHCVFLI